MNKCIQYKRLFFENRLSGIEERLRLIEKAKEKNLIPSIRIDFLGKGEVFHIYDTRFPWEKRDYVEFLYQYNMDEKKKCLKMIEELETKGNLLSDTLIKSFPLHDIEIYKGEGRSPYILHSGNIYGIPRETDALELTEEDCINIIQEKKCPERRFRRYARKRKD